LEVKVSTISKIENGKFSLTIDYLAKFGWALGFVIELKN
jgi:plasmid maintenance system antidote protein VapI